MPTNIKELAEKILDEWRHERNMNIENQFWNTDSLSREEYSRMQVDMDTQYSEWSKLIEESKSEI